MAISKSALHSRAARLKISRSTPTLARFLPGHWTVGDRTLTAVVASPPHTSTRHTHRSIHPLEFYKRRRPHAFIHPQFGNHLAFFGDQATIDRSMATLSSCSRLGGTAAAVRRHHRRQPGRAGFVVTCRSTSTILRTAAPAASAPAAFELGRAPVYWKTSNGLPPSPVSYPSSTYFSARFSPLLATTGFVFLLTLTKRVDRQGEGLTLFYNPAASKLSPNDVFGVAFNGGFNQPIMCGGEPRQMTLQVRGSADPPIYTIRIRVPQHGAFLSPPLISSVERTISPLIFSFTNGTDWDGPYTLQFKVPKQWQNKPPSFFNEGLADELNREGACDRAIYPDENIAITSCALAGYYEEGLDIVTGCMDPNSDMYDPMAVVDDGSCPLESDSEE
ncbi:hypothetical protein HU200_045416 [Digitaria exilis]|uniref:PIFI-like Ig-like domain-containing protein n=1 Tax=Digitaria exilis TaxID=1010633 RepID=A0A835B882_9POAL|nr:hypothetical protein HU200_045416 [Digitaria exilis]